VLFPTIDFAVFFLVAFTGSWVLRPYKTLWLWFLLGCSFVFYGWWDWSFTALLAGSILGNWAFGRAIFGALGDDRRRTDTSRWLVRAAVVANLAVLAWFKYANFFSASLVDALNAIGFDVDPPVLDVILPIALSFFTFQAISYVIDIGRGERDPTDLLRFAVYLSFFPHLVAGPIVRASEFVPQLDEKADPRYLQASEAFLLIGRGLFKKVVVASFLATEIVDPVFASPNAHSQSEVLVAVLGYAVQIYADFSGYTDMAIGVALLLGFRFPQNFDAPYSALSLQDFWRRWHMTLSRWLRDYLYIPLGGSRVSVPRTYVNLFLTMVLGGLWHGASWTFVVWGAIHGGFLGAERFVKQWWAVRAAPLGLPVRLVQVLQWTLTFSVVCVAWIFFRATSMADAFDLLGRLVLGGSAPVGAPSLVTGLVLLVIVLAVLSQFVPPQIPTRLAVTFGTFAPALQIVVFAVAIVVIDALGPEGIAPFIYFQF